MSRFTDAMHQQRFQALFLDMKRALKVQNIGRASAVAAMALREGFDHPHFLHLAAIIPLQEGRPSEALLLLERAIMAAPRDANILNTLGMCHAGLGNTDKAILAYDSAIAAAPDLASSFYNRGVMHENVGALTKARIDYECAIQLQPIYPEALARLANNAVGRHEIVAARDYATRALSANSRETLAQIVLATADLAEGNFEAVHERLLTHLRETDVTPVNRAIALGLIGDAFDGAGEFSEAFLAYARSNAVLEPLYASAIAASGGEPPLARADRLAGYFESAPPLPAPMEEDDAGSGHVFLIGFPRSGTTLLEQALAGHPQITTSEEKNLLDDAIKTFLDPLDGLDKLARISDATRGRYRDAYWSRVTAAGLHQDGKVFIDKLPLNSVLLPLIAVLFPRAKILFALRDPRDVVFSCFRRRFHITAHMFQFLTLEGTARYYDAVMRLSEIYHGKLPLVRLDVRHEDLVADFNGVAGRICEFLGVNWDPAITEFAARAKVRAIDTPSSTQLTRGLTKEGIGVWRRYSKELEGVMPLLAPWVERFGYHF